MWKLWKEGRSFCGCKPAGPRGGVLGQNDGGTLVVCVPAVGPWLSTVPTHVERIRAWKDIFSRFLSWKQDQGDLVTAQRFWACGQARFPSCPSPRQPERCAPSAGSPEPEPPASLGKKQQADLHFHSQSPTPTPPR